jgi:parvulin-like peptidyl-prolyl isomerase
MEVKQTGFLTEDGDFVPGFGSEKQIYRFAFANQVDAVSNLVYTENGYAIFKLSEIRPEGPQPLDEMRSTIESAVRLEKQKDRAREFTQKITQYVANGTSFEQIVARLSDSKLSLDSTSLFSLNSSIPGMGYDPVFNATAFTLEPGQISERIETNRGIFWQKLTERNEFDQTSFEAQRELIRNRILGRKRSQAFNDWYEYLKSQADIEDNRKTFNL